MRFGRCVAIRQVEDRVWDSGKHAAQWECRCDCGNTFVTRYSNLMQGATKSCGCLRRERMSTIGKTWRRSNEYDLTSYDYGVCYFHNNSDEFFIFDKEDYDVLNNHCWAKSTSNGYATTRIGSTSSATAQSVIMGCPPDGMVIDHINRNRLDNRKSNLRFTTRKENARNRGTMSNNTSGYTGVHYQKASRKWRASIAVDYQRIQLGEFDTKEDAYDAYIQARERYWGDTYESRTETQTGEQNHA